MKLMGTDAAASSLAAFRPGRRPPPEDRPTFSSRLLIPVEWERLPDMPTQGTRDATERANAAILDTLLMGVDFDAARVDDEALAEALRPLRLKIDMIFEMLGAISYRDVRLPEPRDIELGLSRAIWTAPERFDSGEWVRIKLYFHKTFREPVALFGRVTRCERLAEGDDCQVAAELLEMSEGVGESFARLIFLEHRRHLALHPDQIAVSRRRM